MHFSERVSEIKSLIFPKSIMKLAVSVHDNDCLFCDEAHFLYVLRLERMRTERSQKPFVLLLLNISKLMIISHQKETITCIKAALLSSLREVDIRGWYLKHHTIGIVFTEVATEQSAFIKSVVNRISSCLCERLDHGKIDKIEYSFHDYHENDVLSSNN